MLRHDPDVIMVGEIRDLETAQIAIQAALTGHLVLSTLHTNNAASTLTRLLDMGVEDYLLTSTLNAIVAQRLVRRFVRVVSGLYATAGVARAARPARPSDMTFWRPTGCAKCNGTGYFGRISINEVLIRCSDPIRRQILHHAEATELQRAGLAGHAADVSGRHCQGCGRRHHDRGGVAGHPRGRLMARFHFRAVTGTGEVVEGELEAHARPRSSSSCAARATCRSLRSPSAAATACRPCASGCASPCWAADGCAARGRGHDPRAGHAARCRPDGRPVPAHARRSDRERGDAPPLRRPVAAGPGRQHARRCPRAARGRVPTCLCQHGSGWGRQAA